jgi:hypothetical protein
MDEIFQNRWTEPEGVPVRVGVPGGHHGAGESGMVVEVDGVDGDCHLKRLCNKGLISGRFESSEMFMIPWRDEMR